MITKIDKEKLIDLIKSFYNLTGIKVAVFDSNFTEIMAYPKKNSSFCTLMHENPNSCTECEKSTENLCMKCISKKKVIIEKCHAGLTEVIAPLHDGISVIGYIMFGQITNENSRDEFLMDVLKKCEKYNINQSELKNALDKILYYSDKQIDDASKILSALAGYIVFNRLVYSSEKNTAYTIIEYIRNNLEKDLSVKELCNKFYLSKSGLYKITRMYMPNRIAAFIKKERIEVAAELLRCTDKPSWDIAAKVGFYDVNYFLRVFKSEMKISASEYRKKHKKC